MDLGLHEATVVVAGGTSGMGRAAAECFAADGARVAVLARSPTSRPLRRRSSSRARPPRWGCRSTSSTIDQSTRR